ncbi:hypothetical protein FALCPG4_006721 [Fusarium falciforme]
MRSQPMSLEHLNFGPPGVRSVAGQPQGFADMLFACLAYSSLSCMRAADEDVSNSQTDLSTGGPHPFDEPPPLSLRLAPGKEDAVQYGTVQFKLQRKGERGPTRK